MQIRNDIPMPSIHQKRKYKWGDMKIGESVRVEFAEDGTTKDFRNAVTSAFLHQGVMHKEGATHTKFCSRSYPKEGYGVIWRIA